MAFSKITTKAMSGDTLEAGDIAANSIGASELADNAVDTAAIVSGAVTTTKVADDVLQVKPHIKLGTLQPAVTGKLLDGSTSHSGAYGTAQSDGRMYYYTDIKGSKPIKDPRIGSHFGSQRHKFKSLQLLEQETATHGSNVYSVDGREWIKVVGSGWTEQNTTWGTGWYSPNNVSNNSHFFEIVGYFSDANISGYAATTRDISVTTDGGTPATNTGLTTSVGTPLDGRYVDAGSSVNLGLDKTLGIHTLKIGNVNGDYCGVLFNIELIAQDTTSTATKSQIQIPSQNVVSYGKKFAIPATAHHYNPFATKGDGSASTIPNNTTGDSVATGWTGSTSAYWDSTLDTATSLGLGAWESGGNFYRPVNGGRVVKWVDSSGNIKTSVNMMPPEAHSIKDDSTGTCDATGTHNWSTQYLPQFGNKTVGSDLVTNGAFASDSGWTKETGWTIAGGLAVCVASTTQAIYQAISLTIGKKYKITYTISGYSAGGARAYIDGGGGRPYNEANGTYSIWFEATATSHNIGVAGKSGVTDDFDVDNFSMYEVEDPSIQAEVAKTFNVRQFGNGSANHHASYKDASTMDSTANQDIAYVMDDGLTSLSASNVYISGSGFLCYNPNDFWHMTFIGTGISIRTAKYNAGTHHICQNLPYGTHILKVVRGTDSPSSTPPHYSIDGVVIGQVTGNTYGEVYEATFHQPKMPPIPEDAVVISDYMLMADFVPDTVGNTTTISKGVRRNNNSRDLFYDETDNGALTFTMNENVPSGFTAYLTDGSASSATAFKVRLPSFGTNFVHRGHGVAAKSDQYIADSIQTSTDGSATADTSAHWIATNQTLGVYNFGHNAKSGQAGNVEAYDIVSPIHTSTHYQPFETPFLYELVGGDRNMEQNNLVVTPDGKSWDEVTRDMSYIGKDKLSFYTRDAGNVASGVLIQWDITRGAIDNQNAGEKCTYIKWDRVVILEDGMYDICFSGKPTNAGDDGELLLGVNGNLTTVACDGSQHTGKKTVMFNQTSLLLKRNDEISLWPSGMTLYGAASHSTKMTITKKF